MINARKAGLAMAALFSTVLVVPVFADGASDFQANVQKAQSTLDQISTLVDNIHARVASGGGSSADASNGGAQQVADTEDTLKCSVCGMTMTPKATNANTRAVTIKGKTYYCCAGCDMSKIADKGTGAKRPGGRRAPKKPANP